MINVWYSRDYYMQNIDVDKHGILRYNPMYLDFLGFMQVLPYIQRNRAHGYIDWPSVWRDIETDSAT